jgi:hypothetical protein
MSRVGLLFERRIPLYIGLPIVIACGAAGYMVSTTTLHRAAISQLQIVGLPEASEAGVLSQPPRGADPSSIVVATPDVHLPAPVPLAIERSEAEPENNLHTTSAPETRPVPEQSREGRAGSKSRRSHRVTRRPKSVPGTAANGIQDTPLLGPVFSLMQ